jgi:N-acetylneuraminate synthase
VPNFESQSIEIAGREVGNAAPVFVIAELGINHNGSLTTAKEMISAAKWAGADAVKFQKRTPAITTPDQVKDTLRQTPWGEMTYLAYKERIEFWDSEYEQIQSHCAEQEILWSASAWDLDSVGFLEKFDIPFHKLASAHLTNTELLASMNESKIPLILSTGMSSWAEVIAGVSQTDVSKTAVLHSVSAYPTEPGNASLETVTKLKSEFPNVIGYSGHESGTSISLGAVALGARIVERHMTLDRTMWGTDQSASMEPKELKKLVDETIELSKALSTAPRDSFFACEEKSRSSLRTVG